MSHGVLEKQERRQSEQPQCIFIPYEQAQSLGPSVAHLEIFPAKESSQADRERGKDPYR